MHIYFTYTNSSFPIWSVKKDYTSSPEEQMRGAVNRILVLLIVLTTVNNTLAERPESWLFQELPTINRLLPHLFTPETWSSSHMKHVAWALNTWTVWLVWLNWGPEKWTWGWSTGPPFSCSAYWNHSSLHFFSPLKHLWYTPWCPVTHPPHGHDLIWKFSLLMAYLHKSLVELKGTSTPVT